MLLKIVKNGFSLGWLMSFFGLGGSGGSLGIEGVRMFKRGLGLFILLDFGEEGIVVEEDFDGVILVGEVVEIVPAIRGTLIVVISKVVVESHHCCPFRMGCY